MAGSWASLLALERRTGMRFLLLSLRRKTSRAPLLASIRRTVRGASYSGGVPSLNSYRSCRLTFREPPKGRARLILGALEGAMLAARSYGDGRRFRATAEHLLAEPDADGAAQRRSA
jgi:hypothetical protein